MIAQNKLQHSAARLQHLGRGGLYFKPLAHGQHAACLKLAGFCVLNKAHAARAYIVDVLQIAKRGYLYSLRHACFKHGCIRLRLDCSSVDFECYHLSKPFLFFSVCFFHTFGFNVRYHYAHYNHNTNDMLSQSEMTER